MPCMVVYRPDTDLDSHVRGNNRAFYSPRVRDYRRGYAITISHVYSSDPGGILCHQILRRQHRQQPRFVMGSSTIHGSVPPFEGRVPYVSVGVPPPACGKDRRRSRAVGDSAVSPPPSPGAALGSCSVPASRIAFRNACERVICRPHAHPRAPARAGPAPSRDRPVPAHPERQPGAHTRARAWCRCRWPLWRVPAET